MPNDTDKPTAEQQAAAPTPEPAKTAPTLTVDRIRQESEAALGVPAYEVAGAFDGVDGSAEISISDAKKRVQDWRQSVPTTDTVPAEEA